MVNGSARVTNGGAWISDTKLEQCIRRNFSGLDDVNPVEIFSRHFRRLKHIKVMYYAYNKKKLVEVFGF